MKRASVWFHSTGHEPVYVEVATPETLDEMKRGLAGTAILPDGQGMAFRFDPARSVRFSMRGMLIALDFIFVAGGRVDSVAVGIEPDFTDLIPSCTVVDLVIELRAGFCRDHGISAGTRAIMSLLADETS